MKLTLVIICAIMVILSINAKRYYIIPFITSRDLITEKSESRLRHVAAEADLKAQPSENYEHRGTRGRVTIKVYRGPDEGNYAPHGYWVRQPADGY